MKSVETPHLEISEYVAEVKSAFEIAALEKPEWVRNVTSILDGGPSARIAKEIELEKRRILSIFFTPRSMADALISLHSRSVHKPFNKVLDPACGAGDLLIAAAKGLPLGRNLLQTLSKWGERLTGCDISPELVDLTKCRLAILALVRQAATSDQPIEWQKLFPGIRVGDGLRELTLYRQADWILLNPPFHRQLSPNSIHWSSGRVNTAALFIQYALSNCKKHARLSAILPEVLRSGSRYRAWRENLTQSAQVEKLRVWGQFESNVDVDVFMMTMIKQRGVDHRYLTKTKPIPKGACGTVGKRFSVSVGPVVPFRDKASRPSRPFISPRDLPPWEKFAPMTRRCTDGPGHLPPFVAVRRTSRPGDRRRAVGTIILGTDEVAVENHLIVLVPLDGKESTCESLLRRLNTKKSDVWMDQRIRCRHLTVDSLEKLPWWDL